ncbi:hypothetical protein AB4P95_29745 (plasmid) [Pseudomonas sp. A1437]|uniref:hypothetical protein n=1 Tax=Pseudomonas sp. A1437 TaxID=3235107 RepID=UPI0037838108
MKHQRVITEADFRLPEFRTAKLEDYELRPGDDKPVRKDRWQTGILQIASAVGLNTRQGFEVIQVVEAVERLTKDTHTWETEDFPDRNSILDIKLKDGSILGRVAYTSDNDRVVWCHYELNNVRELLVAWRESAPAATPNE